MHIYTSSLDRQTHTDPVFLVCLFLSPLSTTMNSEASIGDNERKTLKESKKVVIYFGNPGLEEQQSGRALASPIQ